MSHPEPLQYDQYYHIYNRGIDGTALFREQANYRYFLQQYAQHVEPVADTFAYCLMSNHFHFLLRIKTVQEQRAYHRTETGLPSSGDIPEKRADRERKPSRQFNNFFSTYAKAFNKRYQRTGGLFVSPFKRSRVDSDRYFAGLVVYIHRNPQKHGFVEDSRKWTYSSYGSILSRKPTHLCRGAVLDWFQGLGSFAEIHQQGVDETAIEPLIAEDWV